MKKKLLAITGMFGLAFALGVIITLGAPTEVRAANCTTPGCFEYFSSCSECGGNPCYRFWSKTLVGGQGPIGCCGDNTGYLCD